MTIAVLTGIIIVLLFVLSDLAEDASIYKDKYRWYSQEYGKARQELFETKMTLVKVNKINEKLEAEQKAGNKTINVSVNVDEVVNKAMENINKKIAEAKKREQVFIKVDGKEIDIKELTKAMKKAGNKME